MTIGTLADLAALDGMPSLPSLGRFVASRDDFPVITRGRYGVPYAFELDEAAAFVREHWRDGRRLPDEQRHVQLRFLDMQERRRD